MELRRCILSGAVKLLSETDIRFRDGPGAFDFIQGDNSSMPQ